ncbi:MAG: hypothetical protein M1840_007155 [Geoglossum simile]|nr:MAG: hypothetical protein M1840_007155 [Geoglossum simile]
MAMGFDQLMKYLLEEIALNGEAGASITDIWTYVEDYYGERTVPGLSFPEISSRVTAAIQLRGGGASEVLTGELSQSGVQISVPEQSLGAKRTQTIDRPFKETIWRWLTEHPNVWVGKDKAGNKLTLEQAENYVLDPPDTISKHGVGSDQVPTEQKPERAQAGSSWDGRSGQLRVYGSQEHVWLALTGHGVDWAKCPRLEFICLSVIAKHRENGILQGDLVRETGQDKRSVPRRTDVLAEKGYIEKRPVIAKSSSTSRLTLKRFIRAIPASLPHSGEGSRGWIEPAGHKAWLGDDIDLLSFCKAIFIHLRQQKILTISDLKRVLGIFDLKWQSRILSKMLRRLEVMGCVRRVRAETQFSKPGNFSNCVKFLREPEAKEWNAIAKAAYQAPHSECRDTGKDAESDAEDGGEVVNFVDEGGRLETANQPGPPNSISETAEAIERRNTGMELTTARSIAPAGGARDIRKPLPRWRKDLAPGNLLFQIIAASGIEGISTMDLKDASFGPFCERPMETALSRVSIDWRASQPPHLRHLGVIRDTAQKGKATHYHFYTRDNFQKLVDSGKSIWSQEEKPEKAGGWPASAFQIDEYGFPRIPDSRFLGDGLATLKESALAVEAHNLLYNKSTVVYFEKEDGSFDIDWGREGVRGSRRARPKSDPSEPPKSLGRPRKYPKGLEPYKPENRKKIKMAQAEARAAKVREKKTQQASGSAVEVASSDRLSEEPIVSNLPKKRKRKAREESTPIRTSGGISHRHQNAAGDGDSPRTATSQRSVETEIHAVADPTAKTTSEAAAVTTKRGRGRPRKAIKDNTPLGVFGLSSSATPTLNLTASKKGRGKSRIDATVSQPTERAAVEEEPDPETPSASEKLGGNPRKSATDRALLKKKPSKWSLEELRDILRKGRSVITAPGVYINPPGYIKPPTKGSGRGRPRKSLLAIFKTNRIGELNLKGLGSAVVPDAQDQLPRPLDGEASVPTATEEEVITGAKRGRGQADLESGTARLSEPRPKRRGRGAAVLPTTDAAAAQHVAAGLKRVRDETHLDPDSYNSGEPTGKRRRISAPGASEDMDMNMVGLTKGDLVPNGPETDDNTIPRGSTAQPADQIPVAAGHSSDMQLISERARSDEQGDSVLGSNHSSVLLRGPRKPTTKHSTNEQLAVKEPVVKGQDVSETPRRKAGPAWIVGGGTLAFRRKKIIFDLLDRCGGVFPADRPLWFAWAAVWMKENPGLGKPDYQTLKSVQKGLVDSGKAKMLWFNFTTTKGAQCSKSLVLRLDIEADSPVVKDMQSKIIKEDGDIYLPPEIELPANINGILEFRTDSARKLVPIQEKVEVPRLFLSDGVLQKLQEKQERAVVRKLERERKDREKRIERIEYEKRRDERRRVKKAATAAKLGRRGYGSDEARDMIYSGTSRVSRLHGFRRSKALRWQESLRAESFNPGHNVLRQYTTLYAPTQTFHHPSGTFGTDFLVTIRQQARPVVSVPDTLEDIISHAKGRRPDPFVGRHRDFMKVKFDYEVMEVMRWEERGNGVHFRTPDTRFINHIVPKIATASDQLSKRVVSLDSAESYTLGQPPDLGVLTDSGEERPVARAIRGGRKSFRTHPTKLYKTRKLTAMEATPIDQGSGIEYEQGSGQARQRRLRGPLASRTLSPETAKRMLIAVIVVRTLIGGTERIIDWVIINRLFPQFDQEFIRKRWISIRAAQKLHMEKLQRDFQEAFLASYRSRVVPPIDYDNLGGYDWNAVVDWALANLDMPSPRSLPNLPATRRRLDALFDIRDDPQPNVPFREEFLGHATLVHRRRAIAKSTPFAIPLHQSRIERPERLMLTESLVRANTITSVHLYNGHKAKEKLLPLSDLIDDAIYNLRSRKVLTHVKADRTLPGRNFDLADNFFYSLKKHISDAQFVRARLFKLELDLEFAERGFAEVPFLARDGDMLALNNLLSHGRVKLDCANLPDIKSGLIEGYVTRHIDKKRLRYDIKVRPTDSYSYGNPLTPLPPPPCGHIGDETKPIPIWYDIHGNFVAVMWWKVLAAVLSMLALRPGIAIDEAVKALKPSVEEWELKSLMEWMVSARVAKKVVGGGWITEEWFWMLIDPSARND